MAKRGYVKQPDLPFFADVVEEMFELFKPKLAEWHRFQDKNAPCGNCFDWWASRFGEFIQEQRPKMSVERYLKVYQIFPRIWEKLENSEIN